MNIANRIFEKITNCYDLEVEMVRLFGNVTLVPVVTGTVRSIPLKLCGFLDQLGIQYQLGVIQNRLFWSLRVFRAKCCLSELLVLTSLVYTFLPKLWYSDTDRWTRPKYNAWKPATDVIIRWSWLFFISFWAWKEPNCQLIRLVEVLTPARLLQRNSVSFLVY